MSKNKTEPTSVSVDDFLSTISEARQHESKILIDMMQKISDEKPVMWGPSIIGFGVQHYKYDTGREGDMPRLGFSPRKASITIYFSEGFDRYATEMSHLGKFTSSVSCLYIKELADVNLDTLKEMLTTSFQLTENPIEKPTTVEQYINRVPSAARTQFDNLRKIVKNELPNAVEVLSYGIVGYKIDDKRARVFVSGWKDHVAMYPIPKDDDLQAELKAYTKGKGTLWFPLDSPLPASLIRRVVEELIK